MSEPEIIEVRNHTDELIVVSACRSKLTGRLFIHFGVAHKGRVEVVGTQDYSLVEVVLIP